MAAAPGYTGGTGGKNVLGSVYNYGEGGIYGPFGTSARTPGGMTAALGHKDIGRASMWRSFLAEFFATMAFTWIVTGAIVFGSQFVGSLGFSYFTTAAAYGLAFLLTVFVTQHLTGGYQNPALTFAMMLVGKISILRGILYWIAQITGACIGAALVKGTNFGVYNRALGGANLHANTLSSGGTFLAEAVGATILTWLVLTSVDMGYSTFDHGRHIPIISPIAVGLGYFALNLVIVPVDVGGMNPARSFGTAAVYQHNPVWSHHWIFWVGPFVGAVIGALIYEVAFRRSWISQNPTSYVGQDPALGGTGMGYGPGTGVGTGMGTGVGTGMGTGVGGYQDPAVAV